MKRGQKVMVCHDGKWSRGVEGEVIATRKGHHIKVRFPHPETEQPVEFWCRKNRPIRFMRRNKGRYGSISYSWRYSYFSGWADIDWWMPWYKIVSFRDWHHRMNVE